MTTQKASPETSDQQQVKNITADIERTRSETSATITAIEHRLSPAELADQAKIPLEQLETRVKTLVKEGLAETKVVLEGQIEAAKGAVHEQLVEAKELVHGQLEDAKSAVKEQLHEAKDLVTEGLSHARQAVKEDIHAAIATTKQSIRDATIGRVENFATQAGDVMNDTKDTIIETIRQNPIPAALAGIGVAWLFMNRSSSARRRSSSVEESRTSGTFDGAGRAVSSAAGRVAHGASELVHGAANALGGVGSSVAGAAHDATIAVRSVVGQGVETASHLVDQTAEAATRFGQDAAEAAGHFATGAQGALTTVAHTARDQAMRAERGLATTLESNPLAFGAVAFAAGAAVGYSLPRTQREDALLGGIRDQVVRNATDFAHDAADSVRHLAEHAGDSARTALSEATK
jgi:hypothetical protein